MDEQSLAITSASLVGNGILGVFAAFLLRGTAQLQRGNRELAAAHKSLIEDQATRIHELEQRETTRLIHDAEREREIGGLKADLITQQHERQICQERLARLEGKTDRLEAVLKVDTNGSD